MQRNLDERTKFYEKIKNEQILMKKRMDDLEKFLQNEKQKIFKKKKVRNVFNNKNYTTFRKDINCSKSRHD